MAIKRGHTYYRKATNEEATAMQARQLAVTTRKLYARLRALPPRSPMRGYIAEVLGDLRHPETTERKVQK